MDNKYTKTYVDGTLGGPLTVGASADWGANVVFYDRDGVRMDTTTNPTSGRADFYTSVGRQSGYDFTIPLVMDPVHDGQATLIVDGDNGEFAAGTKKYGYLVLNQDGTVSVSSNYIAITVE